MNIQKSKSELLSNIQTAMATVKLDEHKQILSALHQEISAADNVTEIYRALERANKEIAAPEQNPFKRLRESLEKVNRGYGPKGMKAFDLDLPVDENTLAPHQITAKKLAETQRLNPAPINYSIPFEALEEAYQVAYDRANNKQVSKQITFCGKKISMAAEIRH